VLFEPGAWVPPNLHKPVSVVPIRQTVEQRHQEELEQVMSAKRSKLEKGVLATTTGLLLNELQVGPTAHGRDVILAQLLICFDSLQHSPGGVLEPLLAIFNSIADLAKVSVNSPEASYILYICQLAVGVETYVLLTLHEPWVGPAVRSDHIMAELRAYRERLRNFLHTIAAPALERWRVEAEANQDMPTASVVHAYKAMLWANLRPEEYTVENVTALLSSLAYVHNWHGFGLGKVEAYRNSEGDSEQRLLRFMQAYGVRHLDDTSVVLMLAD
jgi:hypothetical protein